MPNQLLKTSFTGQSVDDSSTVPDPCSPTCAEEIDSGQVSEVASLELYSDEATECTDNPLTNANALSSCSSIHIEADDSISMLVDKAVNNEDGFESQEVLLQRLHEQQWLYSLVKAELNAKMIKSSPSRTPENDDKQTHYYTGFKQCTMANLRFAIVRCLLGLFSKAI